MSPKLLCLIATIALLLVGPALAWEEEPATPDDQPTAANAAATEDSQKPPAPVSLNDFLARVAEQTSLSEAVKSAGAQRNIRGAEMLEMEMLITKKLRGKPQELNHFQTSKVLSLDFHREDLHVRSLELAVKAFHDWGADRPDHLLEQIWQSQEYLRVSGATTTLQDQVNTLTQNIPKRAANKVSPEMMEHAQDTFGNGLGIHVEYTGKPIVASNEIGMTNEAFPLKYIRSPNYPPRGCRVVTKLVFQKEGKDNVFSHYGDYQPCAFDAGTINGQFVTIGRLPRNAQATLLVFVASHYIDDSSPPIPISNLLSIPVLQPTANDQAESEPAATTTIEVGESSAKKETKPTFSLERVAIDVDSESAKK